jgi:hypothetical protein
VKIKGTCAECGRDFMAEQVVATGGECPWCGVAFNPDYAITLIDALRAAEEAGTELERVLDVVADLDPSFTLAEGSITGDIRGSLARLGRNAVRRG